MRDRILDTVKAALEPLDCVVALWEGGSAAFGRVDEWSDIDLQAAVDDDSVEKVFDAVAVALPPVDLVYRVPEPTWHGHSQTFYRFRDAPPTLLLDLAVMKRSSDRRFNERERHGEPRILFDKLGWIEVTAMDEAEQNATLRERLAGLATRFEMFQPMVEKALDRGDDVEAAAFYQQLTWRPLIELLRIRHAPARFDFGPRYIPIDLPPDAAERVRRLAFAEDGDALRANHAAAGAWFRDLLAADQRPPHRSV